MDWDAGARGLNKIRGNRSKIFVMSEFIKRLSDASFKLISLKWVKQQRVRDATIYDQKKNLSFSYTKKKIIFQGPIRPKAGTNP